MLHLLVAALLPALAESETWKPVELTRFNGLVLDRLPTLFPGVQHSSLPVPGAITHSEKPYSQETNLTSDLDSIPANAEVVLLGARRKEEEPLFLWAIASRQCVVKETVLNQPHLCNDVWWYRTPAYSVGFASMSNIDQNWADKATAAGEDRLSWWCIDDASGGYRAGTNTDLGDSDDWIKVVWYWLPASNESFVSGLPLVSNASAESDEFYGGATGISFMLARTAAVFRCDLLCGDGEESAVSFGAKCDNGRFFVVETGANIGHFGGCYASDQVQILLNEHNAVEYRVNDQIRFTSDTVFEYPVTVRILGASQGPLLYNLSWLTAGTMLRDNVEKPGASILASAHPYVLWSLAASVLLLSYTLRSRALSASANAATVAGEINPRQLEQALLEPVEAQLTQANGATQAAEAKCEQLGQALSEAMAATQAAEEGRQAAEAKAEQLRQALCETETAVRAAEAACTVAAAQKRFAELPWPSVQQWSCAHNSGGEAHRIRLECPGAIRTEASESANVVTLSIDFMGPDDRCANFSQKFWYDPETYGNVELLQDESTLTKGVLLLTLKARADQKTVFLHDSDAGTIPSLVVTRRCPDIHSLTGATDESRSVGTLGSQWVLPNARVSLEDGPDGSADISDGRPVAVRDVSGEVIVDFDELVERNSRSQESETTHDSVGCRSLVSAPAKLDAPRCFLANTRFRLIDNQQIIAVDLCKEGGQVLQGPGGAKVETKTVVKYRPQDTDVVEIVYEGAPHAFKITADHPITVINMHSSQKFETIEASMLTEQRMNGARIFDGCHHWLVQSAKVVTENLAVVKITFTDPRAEVLAWLLPRTRPRNHARQLFDHAGVACMGVQLEQAVDAKDPRKCKSEGANS